MSILKSIIYSQATINLLAKRTAISCVLCRKVQIQPQAAKCPPKTHGEDHHDLINMERGRPISPFISIYATEIQGVASIHNRITGAICTLQIACFAIAALLLPESVDFYVDKINSWDLPPFVIFSGKLMNAWPWCYHTIDGARHIIWDLTSFLSKKSAILTSWVVVFLAVVATVYVSLL